MRARNILITGIPRSGTTLTCHLMNKLPDTVALHEPMRVSEFATLPDHAAICGAIERFCADQRASIQARQRATSWQIDGFVPDNTHGSAPTSSGLREKVVTVGELVIERNLPPDFTLAIKHPVAFAAILEEAVRHFPVYALVRNPLAVLASWNSINFDSRRGRATAAERLDGRLTARLTAIEDDLERQISLLAWYYEQFARYLPPESILHYELLVASGGSALSIMNPSAAMLREPLQSQNLNPLYDRGTMLRIGERLLHSDGAQWGFYSRESVKRLLDEATLSEVS